MIEIVNKINLFVDFNTECSWFTLRTNLFIKFFIENEPPGLHLNNIYRFIFKKIITCAVLTQKYFIELPA